MPNMPGTVTKTRTFTAMDGFWSADPTSFMNAYATSSFAALLADAVGKGLIPQAVANHVTTHWLNQYWPTAGARDVLQRGLYWAMRVALYEDAGGPNEHLRTAALPICCGWICSGGKAKGGKERFEVISIESAQQVTLLFLTPSPKGLWGDEPIGPFQPIWATRHIHFPTDNGEHELEQWGPAGGAKTTRTVRPHDYEDYTPPAP
jgi:hypothetical protein